MAYETLGTYRIYEFEQEEIIETQLVANPDTGVVEEVTTLVQQYAHIWSDLIISQETVPEENRSKFLAELWLYASAGQEGEGFTISPKRSSSALSKSYSYIRLADDYYNTSQSSLPSSIQVESGKSISQKICRFDTTKTILNDTTKLETYHDIDGIFSYFHFYYTVNSFQDFEPLEFEAKIAFSVSNLLTTEENAPTYVEEEMKKIAPTPLVINRAPIPTTANNFTDEENPSFSYVAKTAESFIDSPVSLRWSGARKDRITSLQAALSFDGETADIDYRDIPIDGTNYTFNLTETERELLRVKAQGSDTVPIYYLIKCTREVGSANVEEYPLQTATHISATQRFLTVVGCNPSLNPTVKDIKPETLALTGDENTFVRYESMAEYAINATASKQATIVTQYVQCGSKKIEGLPYGVIDDTESADFIFYVLDSRGLAASGTVFKNLVEYVKPTCYQNLEVAISGETGAAIKLTISGNYYNGSFGVADNTLKLEVRYTDDNEEMGEWITLTGTPTFNGNTYELETTIGGFTYSKAYTFQCRATDKLNVVESSQYTIKFLPVFDWSESDFNFNVPVNIEAEDLNMHGETIIRHNKTANNTVVSGSGGNVYIRPNGTDNTSGEMRVYSNGNVDIDGNLNVDGIVNFNSFSINGNSLADYVIETGEESMGSNGTWYWRKWASGKSEAWGCRNFGNMAITTAWGNLYRSAVFTQDLPNKVFVRTPDAININIVHSNFGGWICKHEQTAPSAVTTGSFIFVRPASATASPTNIGFYIVGEWL